MMYWKVPPTKPGEIVTAFDPEAKVFLVEKFEPARFAKARVVLGSCDMNELLCTLDASPQDEVKPVLKLAGETFRFHRSENLGDMVSHVYLHDEGKKPDSIVYAEVFAVASAAQNGGAMMKANADCRDALAAQKTRCDLLRVKLAEYV